MSIFSLSFVSRTRLSCRFAAAFVSLVVTVIPAMGQDKPLPAAKLFPADTQALFSLPQSEAFLSAWNETQFGKLAEDPQLKDFWTTQRKEIQDRFGEAGWQLNLEIEDIKEISGGQTSLGWILRTVETNKPFSIAMIVDVVNHSIPTESFLKRVDSELKAKNAVANTITVSGVKVFQYTLPKVAGEARAYEAFYCLSKNQLFATDDLLSINELLAAQGGTKKDSLADSELYQRVQAKIPNEGDQPEIEYFVRPIGFAKLLRSISGKPIKNQADILLILDREGFGDLECLAGNIQITTETFDFFHHGYLVEKQPPAKAVQILDFPNLQKLAPPEWISKDTATVLSFSWNIKDAFPKFQSIVDALVGPGTFEGMIEGIRDDPQGPQIDIPKDLLPYLSTEFHVVTEIVKPISPDSKQSMVILKLNDPTKRLPKVLDRYGKGEPDSKPIDFNGQRIWSFENKPEAEIDLDFGGGKDTKTKPADEQPLLDKWAMAIFGEYFIFASDVETIKETIRRAKNPAMINLFEKESDVAKVVEMLGDVAGGEGMGMVQITRSDRAFEMQYELFRQGLLPQSRSMMATIMDKILKPKNEGQPQVQKVNGNTLPPFVQIQHYFTASGGVVRTEKDGWSVQSFILKK